MRPNQRRPPLLKWRVTINTGHVVATNEPRTFVTMVRATSEASARLKAVDRAQDHDYDVNLCDIIRAELVQ